MRWTRLCLTRPPNNATQTVQQQLSPVQPGEEESSQGSLQLRNSSAVGPASPYPSLSVDTGLRVQDKDESDAVLLDMPRGSPAEICVRINPGDRVLG